MREESGQNPVFHVLPGGTEAAARRPVNKAAGSIWLVFLPWGGLNGVLIGSVLRWDRLGFHYLRYLNNK